ncbi:MAG: hypothetical protein MZV63_68745 [Marinilabiliales bacterium]|nr:hypothetical protein [Marinilabiliales bacterium]
MTLRSLVNIAANPFSHNRIQSQGRGVHQECQGVWKPLISVNQTGGYTELIFDGSSVLIDADGTVLERLAFCSEEVRIVEIPACRW